MARELHERERRSGPMWGWVAITALVVGVAAILGFTGIVAITAATAKVLFMILLAAFLATVVIGISRHA